MDLKEFFTSLVHLHLNERTSLVVVGCWTIDGERLAIALVVVSLDQWELDLRVVELFDVVTTGLGGDDLLNLDDLEMIGKSVRKLFTAFQRFRSYLDRMRASTMAGSHVAVALSDGSSNGQVTVFTVHVVCARTRVITQPDSEVLDLQWSLLELALD